MLYNVNTEKKLVYRKQFRAGTSRNEFSKSEIRCNIGTDHTTMVHIIEGTGYYRDLENGKTYPYHPGTLILKPPLRFYDQHHDPGIYVDKYFEFPRPIYDFFMTEINRSGLLYLDIGLDSARCRNFDALMDELRFESDDKLPVVILKFCAFAAALFISEENKLSEYRESMEAAVCILETDFNKKMSLPEVAGKVGMSVTNFRRIFKQYFGVSPWEYRLAKKMMVICETMKQKKTAVKELAASFGYTDAYAFSHQFKQFYGESPRSFYHKQSFHPEKNPDL